MGLYKRVITGETTNRDGALVLKLISFFLVVGIVIGYLVK